MSGWMFTLAHCIAVAGAYEHRRAGRGEYWPPSAVLTRCPCAEDCDFMRCDYCGCGDCKHPGRCAGICSWCGEPARVQQLPGDGLYICFSSYCCDEHGDASWAKAESEGRVVKLADITAEQANEMFNRVGLGLAGVGKREPS